MCWVMIHCLEVSCKMDMIHLTADLQTVTYYSTSILQLTSKQWIITQHIKSTEGVQYINLQLTDSDLLFNKSLFKMNYMYFLFNIQNLRKTYSFSSTGQLQSTLVISKSKGPSETLRDIRTSTYQIYRIEENTHHTTKFHKWTCNLSPSVRNICWKYCGKGKKLLLRSSYPQYFLIWC